LQGAAFYQEDLMNVQLYTKNILFLGAGSMVEAIIRGLVEQKVADPAKVTAVNRSNKETLARLQETYGIRTAQEPETVRKMASAADIVVLGMKPKDAAQAIAGFRGILHEGQLLVSVIAGLTIDAIHNLLDNKMSVVRTMPNTSSSIGLGATGISFSEGVPAEQRELALEMFRAVGIVSITGEDDLHILTGVSGSGPAYIYYMMEAMIAGGVKGGLSPEEARKLTVQTVLGAASMVQSTGEDPASLRRKVTSPNGTTQAALEKLDSYRFSEAVEQAVLRCAERSRELGEMITENAKSLLDT
jgi:pyrroline-5-carboxylate reductase